MADRDRQQIALRLDQGLAADDCRVQTDDPPERVADVAPDRDADFAAGDEDAARQEDRIADVAGLVLRREGDGRDRSGRAGQEVARQDVATLGLRVGRRLAPDQRIGHRERAGVSGVLEEALLAVEPPEVERQAGGGHDADERHREEDEDLALGRTSAATSRVAMAVSASNRRHQFATIVTSDVSPSRPFMSFGRNCGMIGMIRSWW